MITQREKIGWMLAAVGGTLATIAAYLQGGEVAALGAAGSAFTAASVAWGIIGKTPTTPAK
jgi:hypothetical protein